MIAMLLNAKEWRFEQRERRFDMGVWIEQNLSLILNGLIGLAAFLILLFAYLKDLEASRQFNKFETAIDDLYSEFYKIRKTLQSLQGQQDEREREIFHQIQEQTHDIITHSLKQTYEHLEHIEQRVNNEIQTTASNLSHLDGKIRDLEFFSSNANGGIDEKKIFALLESGKNVDTIAKELGVTRGEVELFLQLSNIAYRDKKNEQEDL